MFMVMMRVLLCFHIYNNKYRNITDDMMDDICLLIKEKNELIKII